MRAIEDCYTLNPKAEKASIFAGWREMDEYMRDNKLDGVVPVVPRPAPQAAPRASAPSTDDEEDTTTDKADSGDAEVASKPAKRGKSKSH